PIKTPQQLLLAVFFSFVIPVFAIIGFVNYVVSDNKPAGSKQAESHMLGGVSTQDLDKGVAARISKIGTVEIRDANRPLKSGEEVFKAQCATCHGTPGIPGAPHLGDASAWSARIKTGFETLVQSALKGKGAMAPQAGGEFDDLEIARAVAYMANSGGATFAEPQRAAPAATAAASAAAPAAAPVAMAAAPASPSGAQPVAATPAAAPATQVAAAGPAGEALYKQACVTCHSGAIPTAPKFGDKAAWAPRIQLGIPALVQSVVNGKGAMPPKGMAANASEAEIKSAVEYMVNAAK
ncbi:MAG: c-type cytochrome, partial [Pseudomonadota bacterium]